MSDDRYQELARRLAAAAISHETGNPSIDNVLSNHIGDQPVGSYWVELAKTVTFDRNRRREAMSSGTGPKLEL